MATFRPQRRSTRMSMSSVPSATGDLIENKDPRSVFDPAKRKKRAQSLAGGLAFNKDDNTESEKLADKLSPRKRARRSLVPGRSILKARSAGNEGGAADATATINLNTVDVNQETAAGHQDVVPEDEDEDDDQDMTMATMHGGIVPEDIDDDETMEFTRVVGGINSRQSLLAAALARRVSFAPSCQVRLFNNKDGSDNGSSPNGSSNSGSPNTSLELIRPDSTAPSSPSPGSTLLLGPEGQASPIPSKVVAGRRRLSMGNGHRRASSITSMPIAVAADAITPFDPSTADGFTWDDDEQSISMEMAGDDVTQAFQINPSLGAGSNDQQNEEEDASMAMSEVTDDVTIAFRQNTHVLKGMASLGGSGGLGALGFGVHKPSRLSIAFSAADEDEARDEREASQVAESLIASLNNENIVDEKAVAELDNSEDMEISTDATGPIPQHHLSMKPRLSEDNRRASIRAEVDLLQSKNEVDQSNSKLVKQNEEPLDVPMDISEIMIAPQLPEEVKEEARPALKPSFIFPNPATSTALHTSLMHSPSTRPPQSPRHSASPFRRGTILPSPRRVAIVQEPRPSPTIEAMDPFASPKKSISTSRPTTPRSASKIPLQNVKFAPPSSLAMLAATPESRKRWSNSPISAKRVMQSPMKRSPKKTLIMEETVDDSVASSFISEVSIQVPPMSLDEFLTSTQIHFMENKFRMTKRKSIAPPSLARGFNSLSDESDSTTMHDGDLKKTSLASHIHAAASKIPSLELLHTAAQELKFGLRENEHFLSRTEEEFSIHPPILLKEWICANEEDRSIMSSQFKMIKSYFGLLVRNEWYDYKMAMVESLKEHMDASVEMLKQDLDVLASTKSKLESSFPELEARHVSLLAEVEIERRRQADLDGCDKSYLADLKSVIQEQATALDEAKAEDNEVDGQLRRLRHKCEEVGASKSEIENDIVTRREACEQMRCFNKTEVFRLRSELDVLQSLNGWKQLTFHEMKISLVFADEIKVSFRVITDSDKRHVEVTRLDLFSTSETAAHRHHRSNVSCKDENNSTDQIKSAVTKFLFARVQKEVKSLQGEAKEILRKLSKMWTLVQCLRQEIVLVQTLYRITLTLVDQNQHEQASPLLKIKVRVHSQVAKSSFDVEFEITGEEVLDSTVETLTDGVGSEVKVAFGKVDQGELTYVVRDRISRAGRGALLEACQDAEASANSIKTN